MCPSLILSSESCFCGGKVNVTGNLNKPQAYVEPKNQSILIALISKTCEDFVDISHDNLYKNRFS